MSSRSREAESVRDYFIILRKFIDYYKDHISEMILNKVTENKSKFIYILLVNKNKSIFKLGKTGDIRKRLKTYATGKDVHPDIKFIMLVEDNEMIEKCAKVFLKMHEYKRNHEIFKVSINTIKKIVFECANMAKSVDEIDRNKDKDAYIIFEDKSFDYIDYLDTKGKRIGYEKNMKKKKTKKKQVSKKNKLS